MIQIIRYVSKTSLCFSIILVIGCQQNLSSKSAAERNAENYFNECQQLKKIVFSKFGTDIKIGCNKLPLTEDSLTKGWHYFDIPKTSFAMFLPDDAEVVQTESTTDIYPLSTEIRKKNDDAKYRFFLSIQKCSAGQWCVPEKIGFYAKPKQTWADVENEIFIFAFEPNSHFNYYAFSINVPDGHYFAQLNSIDDKNITQSQFEEAIQLVVHRSNYFN